MKKQIYFFVIIALSCGSPIYKSSIYKRAIQELSYFDHERNYLLLKKKELPYNKNFIFKKDTFIIKRGKNTFGFRNIINKDIFVFEFYDNVWHKRIKFDSLWNVIEYNDLIGEDYKVLVACKSTEKTMKVQLSYYNLNGHKLKAVGFIPKGSVKKEQTWDEGRIILYKYDSFVVYLTEYGHKGTPNDSIIRLQKGIAIRDLLPDTASFDGVEKEKYWKEVKRGVLFYGYKDVPISEKKIFDKAINSIKIK